MMYYSMTVGILRWWWAGPGREMFLRKLGSSAAAKSYDGSIIVDRDTGGEQGRDAVPPSSSEFSDGAGGSKEGEHAPAEERTYSSYVKSYGGSITVRTLAV